MKGNEGKMREGRFTVRLKQVNERFQFFVDELNISKNEILFPILLAEKKPQENVFLSEINLT